MLDLKRQLLIRTAMGVFLAMHPVAVLANKSEIHKILEQSRRESEDQVYEWNRSGDARSLWELKPNELLSTSDSIFGRNPTASEVIGNFAAGRNRLDFNIAEQVADRDPAVGENAVRKSALGEQTMIALFDNYKRSRRWKDAIKKFTSLTRSRRVETLPERVRSIVAEAYAKTGNRRSQVRLLESLALNFPVSPEAISSFVQLSELKCSTQQSKVYLSEAYLQRLSRQDIPDSGMKQFILAALSEPIERRNSAIEIMNGVDLLAFHARAGYYDEAKLLGEELLRGPRLDPKQDMKLLLSLSKVYEDTSEIGPAIAMLHKFLERYPTSPERPNIIFQLGELLMKQSNYQGAAVLFASIKRKKLARSGAWMEFFSRYLASDFERAEYVLRDVGNLGQWDAQNPGAREYWLARTAERLGRPREAIPQYLGIARTYSLSYYAVASLARLRELSESLDNSSFFNFQATNSMPRGSTLHDVELVFAAQSDYANKAADTEQNLDADAGKFNIASTIGKIESSQEIDTFSNNFPRPYWDRVRSVSERIGVDPLVMYSIMRAESRFRPGALSMVGAVGLLQIMPYTGSKIARLIGDEFYRADELASPDLNISYGAYYFNFLREGLESLPLAIAAYNAGPKSVLKWYREQRPKDMDLFIERIPFRETRKYVKEVLANLFGYERLYRGKVSLNEMQNLPTSLPDLSHLF